MGERGGVNPSSGKERPGVLRGFAAEWGEESWKRMAGRSLFFPSESARRSWSSLSRDGIVLLGTGGARNLPKASRIAAGLL